MSMFRVDPRVRAYGKARIDITRRAKDEQEWQRQWKEPRYPFPFTWGQGLKHSFQYQVEDFAAEVGFWMDVLGLPAYAFSPSYATFTSPDQAFAFSVAAAPENSGGTPPDTIRIQFMVGDISGAIEELERRGVFFEQKPGFSASPPPLLNCGCFRTPHGICVDLLGGIQPTAQPAVPAIQDSTEEDVEENLGLRWQETEEPLVVAGEQDQEAAEQPSQTGSFEDPIPDDGADPFAGLTFASSKEPAQVQPEPPTFEDPLPEESDPEPGPVKPNGSSGWSHIRTSTGKTNRGTDHRRGDAFPRPVPGWGSSIRGNGDPHRADHSRRASGSRRNNPFSAQDLPPLPEIPSRRTASLPKEFPPPQPEPPQTEDLPPFFGQNQVEKQNGSANLPLEQPGLLDDEPRYEDLEEGADKGLDDIFP
jgi:hypothetical protein